MNGEVFSDHPLSQVEDKHTAIAGTHGQEGGIGEPILGCERRGHAERHGSAGDPRPEPTQSQLEREEAVCRGTT